MIESNETTRHSQSRILAGYHIGKTIGKGTFGKVKLGKHLLTGQNVAVKILQKDKICNEADRRRVDREIQILKKIRHPNIIQLFEIIETPKYMFLITEYAEGGELFDYIVTRTRLSEIEAGRFLQQIINAVQYLHRLGIVHRDLKPENLLLDRNNNIKVVDFGLSNIYARGEQLRTACGSPCYAAPEMVTGQAYHGAKTDVWSCGIILYAMCCGYLPFDDPNTSELYRKIAEGQYLLPSFSSETLSSLLRKVLNVNPERRATFDEIRRHPFCSYDLQPTVDGIIVGVSCIPLEAEIVEQVSKFPSMSAEKVQEAVLENKHNPFSASYYLLLQRRLREHNSNLLNYFVEKQAFIHKYSGGLERVKDIMIKNMISRRRQTHFRELNNGQAENSSELFSRNRHFTLDQKTRKQMQKGYDRSQSGKRNQDSYHGSDGKQKTTSGKKYQRTLHNSPQKKNENNPHHHQTGGRDKKRSMVTSQQNYRRERAGSSANRGRVAAPKTLQRR